jgi:hypothetical protein
MYCIEIMQSYIFILSMCEIVFFLLHETTRADPQDSMTRQALIIFPAWYTNIFQHVVFYRVLLNEWDTNYVTQKTFI